MLNFTNDILKLLKVLQRVCDSANGVFPQALNILEVSTVVCLDSFCVTSCDCSLDCRLVSVPLWSRPRTQIHTQQREQMGREGGYPSIWKLTCMLLRPGFCRAWALLVGLVYCVALETCRYAAFGAWKLLSRRIGRKSCRTSELTKMAVEMTVEMTVEVAVELMRRAKRLTQDGLSTTSQKRGAIGLQGPTGVQCEMHLKSSIYESSV